MSTQAKGKRPSKFWAYVAVLTGLALCIGGVGVLFSDLRSILPFSSLLAEALIEEVGPIAAIFVGLGCGVLALCHGFGAIANVPSRRFSLPPTFLFWIVFAIALGIGNLLLNFGVAEAFLFPPLFFLGAATPTLGVLAWAGRRLGWPATWRKTALSFVSGSTLSIIVTILLGSILPYLVYMLVEPLFFELFDLLYRPGFYLAPEVLAIIVFTALQAPIPEEFAKALGPAFMGRRIKSEREAFFVGMASGAGFAILENMLYQGVYAQWSGWTWGGITLLRGIGVVLHPIGTGIISLALFRARGRGRGWFGKLFRAYLLAVGLHTLWNGGFDLLVYLTGMNYYGGASLELYGEPIGLVLVIFLLLLSAGLWLLLRKIVTGLSQEVAPDLVPLSISRRALAAWAVGCALVIIPIGVTIGRMWDQLKQALLSPGP